MSRILQLLTILPILVMAGCAAPTVRYITRTVPVTVTKYVAVPAQLTQECPKAKPQTATVAEAVSVAIARGTCVDILNGRMRAIRSIPAAASSS